MRRLGLLVWLGLVACGDDPASQPKGGPTITIYHNAVVHTVDPVQPRAAAFAVEGDRLRAVGTLAYVRQACAGLELEEVDLEGACVVPGMIDAHGHLAGLGAMQRRIDLRDARSYAELLTRVQSHAAKTPEGTWIQGGRWDQANWGAQAFPSHGRLSAVTPDHPVLLSRVDGHAALANRKALAYAGITRDTADPPGGEILRDEAGAPTGMLIDNAIDLVRRAIPEGGGTATGELWEAAQTSCFAAGLTCVHDAGVSPGALDDLRARYASGTLKIRVHAMLSAGPGTLRYITSHEPVTSPTLSVRAIKLYMDGALGSRGAWLRAPYADRPDHTGLAVTPPETIRRTAATAAEHGWQVCTHAIGDRANTEVLDAYAAASADLGALRFRLEHAQCLALEDVTRCANLGVIASMQPTHATSDMRWAEHRVGKERLAGCYAWRRLLEAGARIAFGSDFPVESERPLWGLYAAITRQDHAGKPEGGWLPDQCLTAEEALQLFTLDAAYAGFLEDEIGSLRAGKLADFVVLDRDVLTIPPGAILATRVLRTVLGGETVYRAP